MLCAEETRVWCDVRDLRNIRGLTYLYDNCVLQEVGRRWDAVWLVARCCYVLRNLEFFWDHLMALKIFFLVLLIFLDVAVNE